MHTQAHTNRSTSEYQQLYAAHHLPPMADPKEIRPESTRVMVRGKGVYLWDSDGKQYLDGMSGLWCTAVGYGREELISAATRQMQELPYYNLFFNTTHPAVINLSEKLFEILPKKYSHVVYTSSGSEANEVLIRTVRRYWDVMGKKDKKILIARENGYHGSTVGSASLGGFKNMHEMGDLPIPGIQHIGEPYWYGYHGPLTEEEFGVKVAQELESTILELGADKVAAFVAEPFQGAGGVIFPPATYWPEIQRICRKYDVLLCADEVVGGFGRTGYWSSHEYFGFEPDTITVAKGMTSGYVPMGGLVLSRSIAETLANYGGPFAHGQTYQGHPLASAVAHANLKLLHETGIVDSARSEIGPYLQNSLRDVFANHPLIGEVQGTGMAAGVQLAPSKYGKRRFSNEADVGAFCMEKAIEEGLIVRSVMGRITIAPALTSTRAQIDELVNKLKVAVDATAMTLGVL